MPYKQVSRPRGSTQTPHGRKTRPRPGGRAKVNTAKGNAGSGQGKAKN